MRRRHYLASTAALLAGPLAGCAHPNAVLVMDEVSAAEIAERASRSVDRSRDDGRIVAAAVENGSANATGDSPPLDTDQTVEFDGRYYQLSVEETESRARTQYGLDVDLSAGSGAPDGETVDYDDLPEVDRDVLYDLVPTDSETPDGRGDRRAVRWYSTAMVEDSALLPDSEYDAVRYEGERYPIDVAERTRTESDYRYEAEEIAADAAEYAAIAREEYAFTLSGLSDAERDVVEEAIGEGYYEGSADDAFSSVASRFREHPGFDTDEWGGEWLVRYEDTDYWADLQHPPSAVGT